MLCWVKHPLKIRPSLRQFHQLKTPPFPSSLFTITFCRSSGPGGQNVNKLNTKAELRLPLDKVNWDPEYKNHFVSMHKSKINQKGELIVTSEKERTQELNRKDAEKRLKELMAEASVVRDERIPTETPQFAHEKRLQEKKKRSDTKAYRKVSKSDW